LASNQYDIEKTLSEDNMSVFRKKKTAGNPEYEVKDTVNAEVDNADTVESEGDSQEAGKSARTKGRLWKSNSDKDLTKLKRKDLLEIMLAQGREIDRLRKQNAELEAKLASREIEFSEVGSLAEASLKITGIFEDAEEAAVAYLENIRRRYGRDE
jgi:hypothetical protein